MVITPDKTNNYIHPHWLVGNTTVRNPLRIPPALVEFAGSDFVIGTGPVADTAFARWMDERKIVTLKDSTEDVSSIGRKWRGAFEKMGFIYPGKHKHAYTVSPLGRRLVDATRDVQIQQIMRYAVASYRSGLSYSGRLVHLHPLSWTLSVLRALCDAQGVDYAEDRGVSTEEFTLFIQAPNPELDPGLAAQQILAYRQEKQAATNTRVFARDWYQHHRASGQTDPSGRTVKGAVAWASAAKDYSDSNIRYLTASGLLSVKGLAAERRAGIRLVPGHIAAGEAVIEHFPVVTDGKDYLERHWEPADIVIGSSESLLREFREAVERADALDLDTTGFPAQSATDTRESIQDRINEIETSIQALLEREFADRQFTEIPEITRGLEEIELRSSRDEDFEVIDKDLRPSYLEWLLWRAGLALSRGRTDSRAARGFKVDEELRPIGFASGGRADLVFEFETFILVIEATLMAGSRQEAAEGEPVRRHVADVVVRHEKPVYCIFVAARLDLNTIETFRIGRWYNAREELLDLEIIPVTVRQFREWLLRAAETESTEDAYRELVSLARSKPSVEEDAIVWRDDLNELLPAG